ncbi:MAG TPA: hypothetical protein VGI75_04125, partial [Pirellulales bacterium]
VKDGFLTDSPEERAKWKEILKNFMRYRALFDDLDKATSTVEKAKLIALSFSRNGDATIDGVGPPDRLYDKSADLLFKLSTINEPRGLCGDHQQVFAALANVVGLDCIEVNCAHNTCAVYAPELKKWLWIDPQFALMAKTPAGQYMSPLEVRDANVNGQTFSYDFFGTPDHLFAKTDPRSHELYRPDTFCPVFGVEWGNDELTRDRYDHPFLFLPKSIRQFITILFGVHPTYRYLADDPTTIAHFTRVKWACYAVIFLFLVGNLAFPFYYLLAAIKNRYSAPRVRKAAPIVHPEILLESPHRQNLTV